MDMAANDRKFGALSPVLSCSGGPGAHRDTAAVARFLASRRCFLRSAGSSISSKFGAAFRFMPLLSPLPLGSVGSVLGPCAWVPEPDDL